MLQKRLASLSNQWESINVISDLTKSLKKEKIEYYDYFQDWFNRNLKNIQNSLVLPPGLTKKEIEKEVRQKVDELKMRIEEIEKRFPSDSTIDKISSVNDAILATNIESLADSIKKIEEKILTKWDVAIIVFQVIAALGIIFGIVFGILSYFKG